MDRASSALGARDRLLRCFIEGETTTRANRIEALKVTLLLVGIFAVATAVRVRGRRAREVRARQAA